MPLEDDDQGTQAYVYVQNNDPNNSSTSFTYHDLEVNLGETVELTEDQYAAIAPYFGLVPADEVEKAKVEAAEAEADAVDARNAADTAADDPATGLTQSPWTDGSKEPTSDPGDTLSESQNASGSS